jgi:hypothetical protein
VVSPGFTSGGVVRIGSARTHARYATVREGSLLKCSDSMKRSSKFQLMEAGAQDGGCWGVGRLACDIRARVFASRA